MRFAAAFCAMFAGLSATSIAAPLTQELPLHPDSLDRSVAIAADFTVPSSPFDLMATAGQSMSFDPIVTLDASVDGQITSPEAPGVSGAVKVPEPAPFSGTLLGIITISLFGIYRLNFKLKQPHHGRRRTVQIRELTALR